MYGRLSVACAPTFLNVTKYVAAEFKAKPNSIISMPKNITFVEVIGWSPPVPPAGTVVVARAAHTKNGRDSCVRSSYSMQAVYKALTPQRQRASDH
jgi:hypothetical protein